MLKKVTASPTKILPSISCFLARSKVVDHWWNPVPVDGDKSYGGNGTNVTDNQYLPIEWPLYQHYLTGNLVNDLYRRVSMGSRFWWMGLQTIFYTGQVDSIRRPRKYRISLRKPDSLFRLTQYWHNLAPKWLAMHPRIQSYRRRHPSTRQLPSILATTTIANHIPPTTSTLPFNIICSIGMKRV